MAKRGTYVLRKNAKGKYILVPKHLAAPLSRGAGYHIISDTLGENVRHMANGRYSDSKSTHRRWTREAGCDEVGTEKLAPKMRWEAPLGDVRQDLASNWERMNLK